MLKRGSFITFEGTDGTGKSTQIAMVNDYLKRKGYVVMLTREPGGTKISEELRKMVLDNENMIMSFETEALIYAAARAQHVKELIEPALKEGIMVICDRFIDSSLAYQGYARGLGIDAITSINMFAVGKTMPDITFLMELSTGVAMKRRERTGELDRIEVNGAGFMEEVQIGYDLIAKKYPDRIIRIDAAGDQNIVFDRIRTVIDKKI